MRYFVLEIKAPTVNQQINPGLLWRVLKFAIIPHLLIFDKHKKNKKTRLHETFHYICDLGDIIYTYLFSFYYSTSCLDKG